MYIKYTTIALCGILVSMNSLRHNYEISTIRFYNKIADKAFYGIRGLTGTGEESENGQIDFEINIGYDDVVVGDKSRAGWGVECDDKSKNSCSATSDSEELMYLYSNQLKFQSGALYFRLNPSKLENETDSKIAKLPSKIITGGNKWGIGDLGVLGLSPQGAFSNYFTNIYKSNSTLLLSYEESDQTKDNEDFPFKFRAFANIKYDLNSVVGVVIIPVNSTYWSATGSSDIISPAFSSNSTDICFSTMGDGIIQVPEPTDQCDAVKYIICDKKIGDSCTRDNANFTLAPPISFQIDDNRFEFVPDEYLYFDSRGIVECKFGNIKEIRASEVCDPSTELAFGKAFMLKYIPIFQFNFGQDAQIILINHFDPPKPPSPPVTSLTWVVIAVCCSIAIVGTIFVFVLKKKSEEDESFYTL
jgi:hypothetical protein